MNRLIRQLATPILLVLFLVIVFVGSFVAAVAWGPKTSCLHQFPKIVGCAFGTYENLSGGLIGGVSVLIAAIMAWTIGQNQVRAVHDQIEAERAHVQQTRHEKRYAMALALHLEAERIGTAADKRIALVQGVVEGNKHPKREQMIITVLSLMRGEREDISLLSDSLQDHVFGLVHHVDEYNSGMETVNPTPGGPIPVGQHELLKLSQVKNKATSVATELSELMVKTREWRCQKCHAFIDEVLEDGQRNRCPYCCTTARMQGISANMY